MIVAEQPKREYEVTTYVRPYCPKCGEAMECRRTMKHLRYFYCPTAGCGESKVLSKGWQPAQ